MQYFLDDVIDSLPQWKENPGNYVFILPSKRAGFFLREKLMLKAGKSLILPEIWSIESFVEEISGLHYASPLDLQFLLYKVYLDQKGIEKESFFEFSRWGQLLIQDFNEIDRYLIDSEKLFDYLGDIQELHQWTPDGTSSPMIRKRLAFWKSLLPIYIQFRDTLEQKGLGYQGQVYRKAVSQTPDFISKNKSKHYIFVGFNALNTAEQDIIQYFLKQGNTSIYWDADVHYLDDPLHDAGLFMRKYRSKWPNLQKNGLAGIGSYFQNPKKISVTGLPKSVSQVKYCGDLLYKLSSEPSENLDNTALILGDETLLNPMLHSLPSEIGGVNITMGYPLHHSSIAQLFSALFGLFQQKTQDKWRVKTAMQILRHPFLQPFFRDESLNSEKVCSILLKEYPNFVSGKELLEAGVSKGVLELLFPNKTPGVHEVIKQFIDLTDQLLPSYRQRNDVLNMEYLDHFKNLFTRLGDLCIQHPFVSDLKALKFLFEQLLSEDSIDFEGEPLKGLQIMGMLESRNLDFKRVIITSVNEGILPSGKTNSSFIPFDVKKEFGLPTYKEKDAVYTYHFYRLLQRAEAVHICYNTEPDVLEGGEPSRFISQLLNDPVLSSQIEHQIIAPKTGIHPDARKAIDKSERLLFKLNEKAKAGFSPTALSDYIKDPVLFYKKVILGIRDCEQLEETVAANTFGTVLHQALEYLYRPYEGLYLGPDAVHSMRQKAPELALKSFDEHFLKGMTASGKNLIALRVMEHYLDTFLLMEKERLKKHKIKLVGVERKLKIPFNTGTQGPEVYLKGTVDRIEEVDGSLRIIDYKTGMVEPRNLRISDWDSLRTDPDKSKAFQVLCYAWLYKQQNPVHNLMAGVLSFKNLKTGYQWFGLKEAGRSYQSDLHESVLLNFENQLQLLVEEIFNPNISFEPALT
ncbi:PD-(D/E)XK nuclease family protein [Robiginitalea sp. IMCC43444]|uniref:PD-(D/E)XK nuclease family protein n=1 Tax=Robiginitalea sp. IMCC43444 TaxID=3459121 RepID=UPI004042D091